MLKATRPLWLGLGVLAGAHPALADEPSTKDELSMGEARPELSVGWLLGRQTLRENAAFVEAGGAFAAAFGLGRRWSLELPLELRYRQTWLSPRNEAAAEFAPALEFRPTRRWAITLDAGLKGTYRPGWHDQYQVNPDGSLAETDRFSYYRASAGGSLRWGSFKATRVKGSYEAATVNYRDDPAYDPRLDPSHLVPRDRLEHSFELDGHQRWGNWSLKPTIQATYRHYRNAYARDAGTGLTHAGAGGPPPNPVLREWLVEPELRISSTWFDEHFEVTVGYLHAVNIDIFEGYYSYQAPSPRLELAYSPEGDWAAKTTFEAEFRRYGGSSYAVGGSHPPLEAGTRRQERTLNLAAELSYHFSPTWTLTLDARLLQESSNLPDYVPGVYPASRQYSIDWDYLNSMERLTLSAQF